MKQEILTVKSNVALSWDVYKMTLGECEKPIPGQFVEIAVDGFTLRRPFCVYDYDGKNMTVLYKVLGEGTKAMSKMQSGQKTDVLTGLGNGFDTSLAKNPLLIGGGLGAAPLLYLAKSFKEKGIIPTLFLGAKTASELCFLDDFKDFDYQTSTDDGSDGFKGTIADGLKNLAPDFDVYYACGSVNMLKSLPAFSESGFVSMEARMACGFGACMGCSIHTKSGTKRVCKDGPIFDIKEVIFD